MASKNQITHFCNWVMKNEYIALRLIISFASFLFILLLPSISFYTIHLQILPICTIPCPESNETWVLNFRSKQPWWKPRAVLIRFLLTFWQTLSPTLPTHLQINVANANQWDYLLICMWNLEVFSLSNQCQLSSC